MRKREREGEGEWREREKGRKKEERGYERELGKKIQVRRAGDSEGPPRTGTFIKRLAGVRAKRSFVDSFRS